MLLARFAACLALVGLLLPTVAFAQRDTSREALARLEETLTQRLEVGGFSMKELTPAIVVSVAPAFEESRAWYPTAALQSLVRVFGSASLRSCEACMAPRLFVEQGKLEQLWIAQGDQPLRRRGAEEAVQRPRVVGVASFNDRDG